MEDVEGEVFLLEEELDDQLVEARVDVPVDEAKVVADLFPAATLASSTKGWTGHTLGAAGIVEAAICLLALERGLAPGTLNTTQLDPACGPQIRLENVERPLRRALSFSFGFGGSNCVLAFGA